MVVSVEVEEVITVEVVDEILLKPQGASTGRGGEWCPRGHPRTRSRRQHYYETSPRATY